MRFSIGAKLGALASALIVGTVLILAWWMLTWSRGALTRQAVLALADETMLRGGELLHAVQALREDVLQEAGRPVLHDYLSADRRDALRAQVQHHLDALLSARDGRYLQAEYLPPEAGGPPAIRAARNGKGLHIDSAAHALKALRRLGLE